MKCITSHTDVTRPRSLAFCLWQYHSCGSATGPGPFGSCICTVLSVCVVRQTAKLQVAREIADAICFPRYASFKLPLHFIALILTLLSSVFHHSLRHDSRSRHHNQHLTAQAHVLHILPRSNHDRRIYGSEVAILSGVLVLRDPKATQDIVRTSKREGRTNGIVSMP